MSKFSSPFLAKSPLNNGKKRYKKGDILDEGMPEIEATGINIENFSNVQKDKQSQFVTTLGDDEHAWDADTSSSTIMPNALRPHHRIERDTVRPRKGKKFKNLKIKTNYGGGSPLNNGKKIVGENTGEIASDDKGEYVLISETSVSAKRGDTIRPPGGKGKFKPFVKGKSLGSKDGYLIGGDYKIDDKGNLVDYQ